MPKYVSILSSAIILSFLAGHFWVTDIQALRNLLVILPILAVLAFVIASFAVLLDLD
jgi:hypothetical protein